MLVQCLKLGWVTNGKRTEHVFPPARAHCWNWYGLVTTKELTLPRVCIFGEARAAKGLKVSYFFVADV